MLTLGLVVEGNYDEAALKELIKKCVTSRVEVIGRCCNGKAQLIKRFPGFPKLAVQASKNSVRQLLTASFYER